MERFAFRKLQVYQVAKEMVREVSKQSSVIPRDHLDLIWQLRRAGRSVVLNIAEGAAEVAPREKARIYRIAKRSGFETVAALDLGIDAGFLKEKSLVASLDLLNSVIGMLTTMSKKAEARATQRTTESPRPRPRPRPNEEAR
jgi:four helix bundle protein